MHGSPLIGANVLVKGTGTGSIADVNGKFSVSVPTGKDVLVISCIGYKQQEITLKAGQKSCECGNEREDSDFSG